MVNVCRGKEKTEMLSIDTPTGFSLVVAKIQHMYKMYMHIYTRLALDYCPYVVILIHSVKNKMCAHTSKYGKNPLTRVCR